VLSKLESAINNLSGVSENWQNYVVITPSDAIPLDETLYLDAMDAFVMKASLQGLLSTLHLLSSYNLEWDYTQPIEAPPLPMGQIDVNDDYFSSSAWTSIPQKAFRDEFSGDTWYVQSANWDGHLIFRFVPAQGNIEWQMDMQMGEATFISNSFWIWGTIHPLNDAILLIYENLAEDYSSAKDYLEDEYFGLVYQVTATPSDMMWQLDEMGINFTEIDNFTLFSQLTCFKTDDMEEKDFQLNRDKTNIIFGDLNLFDFDLMRDITNDEPCLYDRKTDNKIDGYTYKVICDCLRKIHFLEEHIEIPANESTRIVLIEDAKERYMMNKDKEHGSYLLNLISAMINSPGFKYNHAQVWDMKINAFLDSVRRISKIQNANLLLQSGYSGFGINLKEVSDKQINWLGDL
jgi:hypothetical protein